MKGQQSRQKENDVGGIILRRITESDISLADLIARLTNELGFTNDRILREIMILQSNKKIAFEEQKPYSSFAGYVFSPIALWFWMAIVAISLSLVLLFVTSGTILYARFFLEGALVLFLPGYSLLEVINPKRELDELMRALVSIGLSLALVSIVGLSLNYTYVGIHVASLSLSLSALVLVLLLLAIRRKYGYYRVAKGLA